MNLRDFSTLQIALGISVLAHAALLTVRVAEPEAFNRVFEDTALEVILVNAKGNERPEKAQAVAQASLAGGGDLDQGRATSPVPVSSFTTLGDSHEDAQRQIQQMQEQQMLLLAQLKQQLAAMPPRDPRDSGDTREQAQQEEKRKQLMDMLAEIERRVNEENARPKKHYISPATREAAYAVYVDALRRRIEERGTQNFPQADGKKLYGELFMLITVNHDGSVLGIEIMAGSGNVQLDRRAQAIVHSIGSYGTFTDAMRRQADQIVLPARFRFTHEETLETQLSAR